MGVLQLGLLKPQNQGLSPPIPRPQLLRQDSPESTWLCELQFLVKSIKTRWLESKEHRLNKGICLTIQFTLNRAHDRVTDLWKITKS